MIWTRSGPAVVDGPADDATATVPFSLVAAGGGSLYLTELGPSLVRHYDAARNRVDTLAGDGTSGFAGDGGPAARALLAGPIALARDARGVLYVSDFTNQRIRAINASGRPVTVAGVPMAPGAIATIAGNGEVTNVPEPPPEGVPARETSMAFPRGVAVDAGGNIFYCDIDSLLVRVIHPDGQVETYAGSGWPDDQSSVEYPGDHGEGGPALAMVLAFPSAVTIGPDGDLYVAEWAFNHDTGEDLGVVWRIDHHDHTVHRIAGDTEHAAGGDGGPALEAGLKPNIQSLVFDPQGNLYISDQNSIRRVDAATKLITTIAGRDDDFIPAFDAAAGGHPAVGAGFDVINGMAWVDGALDFSDPSGGAIWRIDAQGLLRAVVRAHAGIKQPFAAAADAADRLFVSEWAHGRIRRSDPDGSLATAVNLRDVPGADASGPALLARTGPANGVAFDEHGDMFITDVLNSRVLQVRAVGGVIRPSSPIRELARLPAPFEAISDHLAVGGGKVYVDDPIGAAIYEIDVATGARRTVAGGDGSLDEPNGIALDLGHRRLFVAEPGNRRIISIDLRTGAVAPYADLPYDFGFPNVNLVLSDGLLFAANDQFDQVYVIDTGAAQPTAEVFAGTDQQSPVPGTFGDGGPARAAGLNYPEGVAVDSAGKLLVVERYSGRVRVVGTSDLIPGKYPNIIRAGSPAPVELAIEGNPSFDATRLIASSVTIAGAATSGGVLRDVNRDGRTDLVVKVRQRDLAQHLAPGAREAAIEARLRGGGTFADADWVTR